MMLSERKNAYPTYEIMLDLRKITRLTNSEKSLNSELETFQPETQKRILQAMQILMADEMAYVLSVENMKRN